MPAQGVISMHWTTRRMLSAPFVTPVLSVFVLPACASWLVIASRARHVEAERLAQSGSEVRVFRVTIALEHGEPARVGRNRPIDLQQVLFSVVVPMALEL